VVGVGFGKILDQEFVRITKKPIHKTQDIVVISVIRHDI
jgi:hypothetical protein